MHHRFMSYDVYMSTRGREPNNASGFANKWSVDTRAKWMSANYNESTHCLQTTAGREYTEKMVPLVRAALRERLRTAPAAFGRAMRDWM